MDDEREEKKMQMRKRRVERLELYKVGEVALIYFKNNKSVFKQKLNLFYKKVS